MFIRLTFALLIALLIPKAELFAQDDTKNETVRALEQQANDAYDTRNYSEAVRLYKKAVSLRPNDEISYASRINGGRAAIYIGKYEDCVELIGGLFELEPDLYRINSSEELLRCLHRLDRRDAIDVEIERLTDLWHDLPDMQKQKKQVFARDTFEVGDYRVVAFQFIEPSGDHMRLFMFMAQRVDGGLPTTISLGSYEGTTQMSRQMEGRADDWRLWHLDEYQCNLHSTLGFFDNEHPDYYETKAIVTKRIEGDHKDISTTEKTGACGFIQFLLPPQSQ